MPFIDYDGQPLEIPRHVHKDGQSLIVCDESALLSAVAAGWVIDPNAPTPSPAPTPAAPASEPDPEPEPVDDVPAVPAAPRRRGRPATS